MSGLSSDLIDGKVEEIKRVNGTATLLDPKVLRGWAVEILTGGHESMMVPPPNLHVIPDETEEDFGDDDNEFGEVVEFRGVPFVICNGLVVPKDLLETEILPRIQRYLDERGITMDEIFSELMSGIDAE